MERYIRPEDVPTTVLAKRLDELSDAVTKGQMNEFDMRVPAELDRDADIVLSEAAKRLRIFQGDIYKLRSVINVL